MIERHARAASHRLLAVLVLTCTILSLLTATAGAQTPELTVSIDGFSSRDWPQGQAILTVLGQDGKPVEGLSQQDLRATVDGEAVAVTSVSRGVDSNLPSFVVLAIDSSAGMTGPPLDQAKLAAHQFVDALGLQDSIAILAYSDTPNLVQPFTQDRAAAHGAIDGLVAGGGNGPYSAATQGVLLGAASAQSGRRALVLLSSGPNDTQGDPRQSLVAAQGLGVPVFAIGLGSAIDRSYLQDLTTASGGRFAETATPEGLVALYAGVSELLRNQYVVSLDATALDIDTSRAATLAIDVEASVGSGGAERVVCPATVCASFRELEAGVELNEATTLVADVMSSQAVQSVTLLVDGEAVETLQDPPYEFSVNPGDYASGDHTLSLRVTTSSENATFAETAVVFSGGASGNGSGSSSLMPILVVVLAVLIVAIVAFFLLRRRKHGGQAPAPVPPQPEPQEPVSIMIAKNRARSLSQQSPDIPPPAPVDMEPVLGFLNMTEGPLAGQSFSVGAKPLSIGSGHRCQIRLPAELDGQEVPSEYARVWIRGEQLMVHEIRRLTAMGAVGGQWEILSDRDTFAIGSCVFKFNLDNSPDDPVPEPIPNVLRDQPGQEFVQPQMGPVSQELEAAPAAAVGTLPAREPEEPLPDIFRDRHESADQETGEPPAEQAAG